MNSDLSRLSSAERQRIRENAARWIANGTAEQQTRAQHRLMELDNFERIERAELSRALDGDDRAAKIAASFQRRPPTKFQRKLIIALVDHPGSTSEELSRFAGYEGNTWHLHFGTMCADHEADLWQGVDVPGTDRRFMSGILAELSGPENRFALRAEALAAFKLLGIV